MCPALQGFLPTWRKPLRFGIAGLFVGRRKMLAEDANSAFASYTIKRLVVRQWLLSLRCHRITMMKPAEPRQGLDLAFTLRAHASRNCCTTQSALGISLDSDSRYSPGPIAEVISKVLQGKPNPEHISTSHIERQNLTMRMQMRRLTRLTNAFSKKVDNLKAAVSLHFAWYNFCRVHKTLRVTPAMQAGITDRVWDIAELLS
jgi:hypothetical protein